MRTQKGFTKIAVINCGEWECQWSNSWPLIHWGSYTCFYNGMFGRLNLFQQNDQQAPGQKLIRNHSMSRSHGQLWDCFEYWLFPFACKWVISQLKNLISKSVFTSLLRLQTCTLLCFPSLFWVPKLSAGWKSCTRYSRHIA